MLRKRLFICGIYGRLPTPKATVLGLCKHVERVCLVA